MASFVRFHQSIFFSAEVGIYKRKVIKVTRKQELDQENKKTRMRTRTRPRKRSRKQELDQEKKKKTFFFS